MGAGGLSERVLTELEVKHGPDPLVDENNITDLGKGWIPCACQQRKWLRPRRISTSASKSIGRYCYICNGGCRLFLLENDTDLRQMACYRYPYPRNTYIATRPRQ